MVVSVDESSGDHTQPAVHYVDGFNPLTTKVTIVALPTDDAC